MLKRHKRAWRDRIGQKFVDRLPETVVKVGSDEFTRRDLVIDVESANFQAAAALDEAIQHFHPKGVVEVSKRVDQHMLRARGYIGDTAIFVWCGILEAKGVNVDRWLDQDFTERNKERRRRRLKRRNRKR